LGLRLFNARCSDRLVELIAFYVYQNSGKLTMIGKQLILLGLILSSVVLNTTLASDGIEHFNSKGKAASQYTIEKQKALRKSLPFEDKRVLKNKKGASLSLQLTGRL